MADLSELERRITAIEDIEAIKQLKYLFHEEWRRSETSSLRLLSGG